MFILKDNTSFDFSSHHEFYCIALCYSFNFLSLVLLRPIRILLVYHTNWFSHIHSVIVTGIISVIMRILDNFTTDVSFSQDLIL